MSITTQTYFRCSLIILSLILTTGIALHRCFTTYIFLRLPDRSFRYRLPTQVYTFLELFRPLFVIFFPRCSSSWQSATAYCRYNILMIIWPIISNDFVLCYNGSLSQTLHDSQSYVVLAQLPTQVKC